MVLSTFEHVLPETIFQAVEIFGSRATGRFLALNAMENRVYDVEMEDGTRRVVKFYRPGRWPESTIQAEHDYLKALLESEIPVVTPMLDKDQKSLHTIAGVFFAVFPKKQGRLEPELNEKQLERLGRFLARIHLVGKNWKKVDRPTLSPQSHFLEAFQKLKDLNTLPDYLVPKYEDLVSQIFPKLDAAWKNLETSLLHGDCHSGNVLWKGDEPFFLDFDDMLYGPPVQDIWMLTGADDEYGKKQREILLDAYEEMSSFPWESLKLIPHLRTMRLMSYNLWITQRWADPAFKMAFPYFGTPRYWEEQHYALYSFLDKL